MLFSREFTAEHIALYGEVDNDLYFIILRELYDTQQRSVMYQNDIEAVYSEINTYFETVFMENLLSSYTNITNTFQNTFNSFAENPDYADRFEYLADLNRQLMGLLEIYRSNLTRTASLLEQVQAINHDFSLQPHPDNVTITVAPLNWLLLETLNPDLDWNPEIFRFETLSLLDEGMLRALANTSSSGPDFLEIARTFNNQSSRQNPTITFSPGEGSNVFNTERNHPVNTADPGQYSSDDEETKPNKRKYSDDEETEPDKRKKSDDEETEPDKGENSADEEAEPQPQDEDEAMDDL